MTSPLERAARALCEVRGADGWPLLNADPDFGDYPLTAEGTDDTNPFTEANVLAMVRAVIEAIREPSETMAKQMGEAAKAADTVASSPDWKGDPYRLMALASASTMIDALLAEGA